jgi:hypothetical protein
LSINDLAGDQPAPTPEPPADAGERWRRLAATLRAALMELWTVAMGFLSTAVLVLKGAFAEIADLLHPDRSGVPA